jgi:hypothetical protein
MNTSTAAGSTANPETDAGEGLGRGFGGHGRGPGELGMHD